MRHTVDRILANQHDYKLCKVCGMINWYEREICIYCGSNEFNEAGEDIAEWINNGAYTSNDLLDV